MQNYPSKFETAIIIAGDPEFRRFQFFFPFQCPYFGFGVAWVFVRRFKTGKHMQKQKYTKVARRQETMPPAIVPEKAMLHTLEDAGIVFWGCNQFNSLLGTVEKTWTKNPKKKTKEPVNPNLMKYLTWWVSEFTIATNLIRFNWIVFLPESYLWLILMENDHQQTNFMILAKFG